MADSTVNALTAIPAVAATDLLYVVRPAGSPDVDYKATFTQVATFLASNLGLQTAGIADAQVTYAKMQNVSATDKILGRATAGAGVVEEITCTATARSLLDDTSVGAMRTTLGLATVAATGSYSDLSGTPTLGALAALSTVGTSQIDASSVTNAKLANMNAHTFKGNNTAGAAAPTDLTATQLTAELNGMVGDSGSGGTKGLVPAPGVGDAAADKHLKADGTWEIPVVSKTSNAVLVGGGSGNGPATSPMTVDATTGAAAGFATTFNNQVGTTYTVLTTDTGKTLTFTNASAITVTLPNNMPIGWTCECIQGGAGQVSFTGGGTIQNRSTQTKIAGQYGAVRLVVVTNAGGTSAVYNLAGDTGT